MKNIFKKISAAIIASTTIATSIASISSSMTASASTLENKTYRIYFDVPVNSGVCDFSCRLTSSSGVPMSGFINGTLGGESRYQLEGNGTNSILLTHWGEQDLTTPGTLFVVGLVGRNINSPYELADLTYTTVQNYAFVALPHSRVQASYVLIGDVNQDGAVNQNDLTLLQNYLNGTATLSGNALRAADTDASFGISEDDITRLNNFLTGKLANFSA